MINYILQGAIFITAIFLMFMIIRPTSKGGAQISLLFAGLLLYGINSTLGKIGDEANLILWGIFAVIFVILSLLFFTDKKIDGKTSFGVVYLIFLFVSILVTRGCYLDDSKKLMKEEIKQNEISVYKKKYIFNIDSLGHQLINIQFNNDAYLKPEFPIVVFRKVNGKIEFEFDITKSLDKSKNIYTIDQIKTIAIIEESNVYEGSYSNGKTKAYRVETNVTLIDNSNRTETKSFVIVGSSPPSTIRSRTGAPASVSGRPPSNSEISDRIINEINAIPE
jgi:hypothetical protein